MTDIEPLPASLWEPIVRAALAEDLGDAGDLTSQTTLPPDATADGHVVARAAGVIAGLDVALSAFRFLDGAAPVEIERLLTDGTEVGPGVAVARVAGPVHVLLGAERTALNLLGHLSGIATATRELVRRVEGTGARITDTRKTTPGLRALEKYAVRCGGGVNHRLGLHDAVLIKDNHIVAVGNVGEAVRRARAEVPPGIAIQVEVDDLTQLEEALAAGAEMILLDNMPPARLREAVQRTAGRALLEASGGITPETVRAVAETGVDRISVGWITHSAPALDVALDLSAKE
ncbi:MAG: carboxylating nicotinate-nucleotide diphosphorylase [Thermoanaerobaculia bacterium]